jgi:branched-chain amino acid transport system permease protein
MTLGLRLISGDRPRSRTLAVLLFAVLSALLLTPFLFRSTRALATGERFATFALLAASYDLLLGYAGIVSFAHTMFFGIGAYATAIALSRIGPHFAALAIGIIAGLALSMALACLIGLSTLRVRAIFFAMVTLAVGSAFATVVSQLSNITGGENGLNYRIPPVLTLAFQPVAQPVLGVTIDGKLLCYYTVVFTAVLLFVLLLRVVNSPFGRVLVAIRENPVRAEAIGYRVIGYRTAAIVIGSAVAALAGVLQAIWLGYTGPNTTLAPDIMVDVLLMVVIGGMGTMYGAAIGASIIVIAQNYLQNLLATLSAAVSTVPLAANALQPDRWLLWLGILFIVSVYFFPDGIVGRLRRNFQPPS